MIKLSLVKRQGLIYYLQAVGHADNLVVCTAVSLLLRSSLAVFDKLSNKDSMLVRASAEHEGLLRWQIISLADREISSIQGLCDLLLTALRQLQIEYPQQLEIEESYGEAVES